MEIPLSLEDFAQSHARSTAHRLLAVDELMNGSEFCWRPLVELGLTLALSPLLFDRLIKRGQDLLTKSISLRAMKH